MITDSRSELTLTHSNINSAIATTGYPETWVQKGHRIGNNFFAVVGCETASQMEPHSNEIGSSSTTSATVAINDNILEVQKG